jgi:hypothetical protein
MLLALAGQEASTSSTSSGKPADSSILSAKWMNSKQVAQLARESGVFPCFILIELCNITCTGMTPVVGTFSDVEKNQLDAAIEKYRVVGTILRTILNGLPIQSQDCGLTDDDIRQIIMYKGKNKSNQSFWTDICKVFVHVHFI